MFRDAARLAGLAGLGLVERGLGKFSQGELDLWLGKIDENLGIQWENWWFL
jgi:hypothetical protein